MIKTIHLTSIMILIVSKCFAQIPNNGFETWKDESPVGYVTSKVLLDLVLAENNVNQTSDSYAETSAIILQTIEFDNIFEGGKDTVTGTAITGDLAKKTKGFPFALRPDLFSGYFKSSFEKKDTAVIQIGLYKWNTSTMKKDSIGAANFSVDTNVAEYTHFMTKFTYVVNDIMPDTAVIYLSSSLNKPMPNSTLYIDNLMIDEKITATNDQLSHLNVLAYPNPASDQIQILNIPASFSKIEIYDITGRKIEETFNVTNAINLSMYTPGLYQYSLKDANGNLVAREKFSVIK